MLEQYSIAFPYIAKKRLKLYYGIYEFTQFYEEVLAWILI